MVPFLAHQNESESAEAVIAFGKELTFFVLLLISVVIILSSWLDSPKGSKINFCYSTKAQQQKNINWLQMQ